MTLATSAATLVALLDGYVGARYCVKLLRKETQPRIATWLIFEIGIAASLIAYFSSKDHSVAKAALNLTDAAVVTAILGNLLAKQHSRILFTRNEQVCLTLSCLTLGFWAITRSIWVGLAGFQIVMSLAYVPTIESLWHWKPGPAPEPIETWSINALAALIGFAVSAISPHRDYLAMLYPLRAFLLCAAVVMLLKRWGRRNARAI